MQLQFCTTCPRGPEALAVAGLLAAAKQLGKQQGFRLKVGRSACLAACGSGHAAVLESDAGVARLCGLVGAVELAAVVAHAQAIVSASEVPEPVQRFVLSRLRWADLD